MDISSSRDTLSSQRTASGQMSSIQALRLLAAVAVIILHALTNIKNNYAVEPFGHYAVGAAGVDLFFVISGFTMVYSSSDLYGTPGAWLIFIKKRVARIVPIYWLAMLVYALLLLSQSRLSPLYPDRLLASVGFIPYPNSSGDPLPFYSIGWTLNYEMFFYIIFSFTLATTLLWSYAIVVATLITLVVLGRIVSLSPPLLYWAHPMLLEFVLGMSIGLLKMTKFRLNALPAAGLCLAGLSLLFAASIFDFRGFPPLSPTSALRWLIWGFPSAMLLAGAALTRCQPAWTNSILAKLGTASYSLYLVHIFLINGLRPIVPLMLRFGVSSQLSVLIYLGLVLATACSVSLVVCRWLEQPVYNFVLRHWLPTSLDRPPEPRSLTSYRA